MQRLDMLEGFSCNKFIEETECMYCGEPLYITDSLNRIFCSNLFCPEKIANTLYIWLGNRVSKSDLCKLAKSDGFESVFSILDIRDFEVDSEIAQIIQDRVNTFTGTVGDILALFLADNVYCDKLLQYVVDTKITTIEELYEKLKIKESIKELKNLNNNQLTYKLIELYRYLLISYDFLTKLNIDMVM